ncbi:hypothetical protein GCM10010172_67690 [Paractinoplanes ferrugineus]|uniref:Uncharacterized protein n=1 Tax=Paractinoplanes ferrugineus TaxID=113564 RepID=A0A919J343_9ACTN|nr:hypothetical protein Afe05nite_49100 [Actinoplanes ferrugineus]
MWFLLAGIAFVVVGVVVRAFLGRWFVVARQLAGDEYEPCCAGGWGRDVPDELIRRW